MPKPPQVPPNETRAHVGAFVRYLEFDRRVRPRTVEAYRYALGGYLKHLKARRVDPARAGRDAVLAYLEGQQRRNLSAATRFQAIIAIRQYHRFLLSAGHAGSDPTAGITLPKIEHKLPQPLTLEEAARLLDAPKGARFSHGGGFEI